MAPEAGREFFVPHKGGADLPSQTKNWDAVEGFLNGEPIVMAGTATPEGAVIAPIGALFLRTDGGASTTLYVKESGTGNTGWVAK